MSKFTRRAILLGGGFALTGCSTLSALNAASEVLDTYDFQPAPPSQSGRRTTRTLLVARPGASAVHSTDRIVVRPNRTSVTYLPDARWSDEIPAVLQSLMIRSISASGRVGYVGRTEGGPVPDTVLLARIDAFDVNVLTSGLFQTQIAVDVTLVNDKDQRVVASRYFSNTQDVVSDEANQLVSAFQGTLNSILPEMSDWVIQQM